MALIDRGVQAGLGGAHRALLDVGAADAGAHRGGACQRWETDHPVGIDCRLIAIM
ncbi:hypothetical protein AB0L57_14480 [Nocardia sp. NPDC052254]|uniref:hypothetical protein n=1 Tax=Nocardia sp. NPDC052254 TaxID=3155681 RepID=UPI00342DCFC0